EKRHAHPEAVVFPGRRPVVAELLLEALLALRGQLVDRAAALPDARDAGGFVLGDETLADHVLQAWVERSVGDPADRSEQRGGPLAQLVAVQRRLVQQAE